MEPQRFALAIAASASRSSMAPVSTVPAVRGDKERRETRRAIRAMACSSAGHIDLDDRTLTGISAQRVRAQPGHIHRLGDAAVRAGRGIGGEASCAPLRRRRVRTSVPSSRGSATSTRDQVGHRSAGHEQSAGRVRESRTIRASSAIPAARLRSGIWSRPPRLAFSPAASISASMPTGVPPPCTQPMKPGWALPARIGQDGWHECLHGPRASRVGCCGKVGAKARANAVAESVARPGVRGCAPDSRACRRASGGLALAKHSSRLGRAYPAGYFLVSA